VLAGVFVPRSARAVRYLRDQVPGIDVPAAVLERMDVGDAVQQARTGIDLALEIVDQVRQIPGVSGIHLMAIRNEAALLTVVEEAGLLPRPASGVPGA